jgi:Ribonuclease-III-like
MRWTPAILPPSSAPSSGSSRSPVVSEGRETGLFKVRGVCLEAVVGAIYHQHGASMAQLFFQSQILPTLTTRDSRWSVSKDLGEWVKVEMEKCAEESTSVLNGRIQMQMQAGAEAETSNVERLSSQQATTSAASPAAGPIASQTSSAYGSRTPPPDSGIESRVGRQAAMA